MVLSVSKLALVGMSGRAEGALPVEFAVEKLSFELVAVIEADVAAAVLEVVVELSHVDILAYFAELAIAFEEVPSELSLILLFAVG